MPTLVMRGSEISYMVYLLMEEKTRPALRKNGRAGVEVRG